MSRDRSTYRAARRNACIRELKGVWGPYWYYPAHNNAPRWYGERMNKAAIYVPAQGKMSKATRKRLYSPRVTVGGMKSLKGFRRVGPRRSTGIGGG